MEGRGIRLFESGIEVPPVAALGDTMRAQRGSVGLGVGHVGTQRSTLSDPEAPMARQLL